MAANPAFAILSLTGKYNEGQCCMDQGGCKFYEFAQSYDEGVARLIALSDQYSADERCCSHTEEDVEEVGDEYYFLRCNLCSTPYVLMPLIPKTTL